MAFKITGSANAGDSTHHGPADVDKYSKYLSGYDLSVTEPADIATQTRYRSSKLQIRDPSNTHSVTIAATDGGTGDYTLTIPALTANDSFLLASQGGGGGGASLSANNTWTGIQTFNDTKFALRNPANTFSATVGAGAQTAARTFTFPVTTSDTIQTIAATQTVTNKTFSVDLNTFNHSTTNAAGDILKSDGTKFTRLARGTANQVLQVNSGGTDIAWATISTGGGGTGDMLLGTAQTVTAAKTFNDTTLLLRNPADTFSVTLGAGAQGANKTFTFPVANSDTIQTIAATQTMTSKTINASNNTITDTSTALGDILKSDGTKFTRLARGTNTQVLTATATDITWASPGALTATNVGAHDFYVYIDRDDSNKYKARNNRTGVITTDTTNADVVIQAAIDYLSTGSTQTTTAGPNLNLWTGGQYGSIYIGPGTYNIGNAIVGKSNIIIQGSGMWNTELKLVASHANNNNATIFKSSKWDTQSVAGGSVANSVLQQGDTGIVIRDLHVNGNSSNNATVTTTTPTPGVASWGHGIAIYGVGHLIENVAVSECRGAGIIMQATPTNMGDSTNAGHNKFTSHLNNIYITGNGQQGVLCRAELRINTGWIFSNGEPGIDVQRCGYFTGNNSFFKNIWMFYDSMNHSSGDQLGTVYDSLGSEIIVNGNCFMSDMFIEGPFGQGDNLTLGRPGASSSATTDYTLYAGFTVVSADNLYFDGMRKYAINMEPGCSTCDLRGIKINGDRQDGGSGTIYYNESTGIFMNGCSNNYVKAYVKGLNAATNGAALIIGSATTGCAANQIELEAYDNTTAINWARSDNAENSVVARIHASGTEVVLSNPTNVNYVNNNLMIQQTGNNAFGRGTRIGKQFLRSSFTGTGNNLSVWPAGQVSNVFAVMSDIAVPDSNYRGEIDLWGNNDAANYEVFFIASHGTNGYEFGVDKGGTGSLRPFNVMMGLGTKVLTFNTDLSMDFNSRTVSNLNAKDTAQSPIVRRWGSYQPAGGATATTAGNLDGALSAYTITAGGTNSTTFDAVEGMITNLQSAATSGVVYGLVSPTSGAFVRTAFAVKATCRFKMGTTTSSRFYFGFAGVSALPNSDTPMASGIPGILVGFSSADTNFVIRQNDATGAVTVTNVTGPIAKNTSWHTIEINWSGAGTSVNVIFDGVTQNLTTDIPATTSDLWFHAQGQTAAAAAQTLSLHAIWLEAAK